MVLSWRSPGPGWCWPGQEAVLGAALEHSGTRKMARQGDTRESQGFQVFGAVSRVQPPPAAQVSRTERLGDLLFCINFIWHHRIDDSIVLPGLAVSKFCNVNLYSMTQDVMKGFNLGMMIFFFANPKISIFGISANNKIGFLYN